MSPNLEAPTSIPVPSADLINYRFDQAEKRLEDMNTKLDTILIRNAHFMTEEQIDKKIAECVDPIEKTLSTYRWYIRAVFSAALLAILTAVFTAIHGIKL